MDISLLSKSLAPTGLKKHKWGQYTFKKIILSVNLNILSPERFYFFCLLRFLWWGPYYI